VDGDTLRLEDGTLVRYIGVDTPETRRRKGNRWVKDPQPFAAEALALNRRLVEGRQVRLEPDVQPRDRYGRRLAYVFVDGEMVNERLLREGVAQLLTIPPNVKYVDRFKSAQQEAKDAGRGLWASGQAPRAD
jgi:micrococcal nuclease